MYRWSCNFLLGYIAAESSSRFQSLEVQEVLDDSSAASV